MLQYVYICGGQETSCTSHCSSSTMCPGEGTQIARFDGRTFTYWAISLNQPSGLKHWVIRETFTDFSLKTTSPFLYPPTFFLWHITNGADCGMQLGHFPQDYWVSILQILLFCSVTSVHPGQCLGTWDIWETHSFLCSVLGYLMVTLITLCCIFIYFACECVWTMFHVEHIEITGQHVRISSLLPYEVWGFSSCLKAWQQESSTASASIHPVVMLAFMPW